MTFPYHLGGDTSQVISALWDDDVDTLAYLLDRSSLHLDLLDKSHNNVLQLSIILNKYSAFQYFLSLNYFDLEATNCHGETALMLALCSDNGGELYALRLIDEGANVHVLYDDNNTLLHLASKTHSFSVALALIKKGVDLNVQNDEGCTPLHMVFHMKCNPDGVDEGVGLLLYYGADVSVCDNNGCLPFELAVIYDPCLVTSQETLMLTTFDSESDYVISSEVLLELWNNKSRLLYQIAELIVGVEYVRQVGFSPVLFFNQEVEFLEIFIEKLQYIIRDALKRKFFVYDFKPTTLNSWDLLLNSQLRCEVIDFIGKMKIEFLLPKFTENLDSSKDVTEFILYLLSYGLNVSERDLDCVYKTYRYGELFKFLLHMEIVSGVCDIVPRIIYDIELNLDEFLEDPCNYSLNAIDELLDFFADPKMKSLCLRLNVKRLIDKVGNLPAVPFLMQSARDATRKYLIERFCSKKCSRDFYWILNRLPLSVYVRRILSFEIKFYKLKKNRCDDDVLY